MRPSRLLDISRLAALLLICALGLMAPMAASAQDAFARFESQLKPKLPPGSLTYGSGAALGNSGFILRDVIVQVPPSSANEKAEPPFRIKTIAIEDIDIDKLAKDEAPSHAKLRLEGVELPLSGWLFLDGLTDRDLRTVFGTSQLVLDVVLDYRFEAARSLLTLSMLDLDLHGLGRFEISLLLDGFTETNSSTPQDTKYTGSLRSGSLIYSDSSLLGKLMPLIADEAKLGVPAMIEFAIMSLDALAPMATPATKSVIDAMAGFLTDYENPKGALRITLAPTETITTALIETLLDIDGMVKAAGLSISYAGARNDLPTPGPRSTVASAPTAKDLVCRTGARFFGYSDGAWSAVTAREATASNRCVVRHDDGSADNVVLAMSDLIAWSLDGPGKPVSTCSSGDAVIGETDGIWYPAKVKKGVQPAGQCAVTYDGMDSSEDEVLPIRRVRTLR
jgi:hypothetical protein